MARNKYCGNCGDPLGSENYCTACGTKVSSKSKKRAEAPTEAHRSYLTGDCRCEKCGRAMVPSSSGRGDTYCSCEEDAMSPEEREKWQRWIFESDRR